MNMDLHDKFNQKQTLVSSFKNAFSGIKQAFRSERNIRFHFFAMVFVLIAAIILKLDLRDWIIILILIGLVMAFELMNTAIETTVDLVVGANYHRLAKKAKDIAAASVLVISILAAIIGIIVFLPYLIPYLLP